LINLSGKGKFLILGYRRRWRWSRSQSTSPIYPFQYWWL